MEHVIPIASVEPFCEVVCRAGERLLLKNLIAFIEVVVRMRGGPIHDAYAKQLHVFEAGDFPTFSDTLTRYYFLDPTLHRAISLFFEKMFRGGASPFLPCPVLN